MMWMLTFLIVVMIQHRLLSLHEWNTILVAHYIELFVHVVMSILITTSYYAGYNYNALTKIDVVFKCKDLYYHKLKLYSSFDH